MNFKLENKIDKIDETLERIEKSIDCLLILTFMDKGRITKRNSEFNKILDDKLNEILLKYQKKNNKNRSKEKHNENKIININNQSKISANILKTKKAFACTNTHYSSNNRRKNIKNNKSTPIK